MSMSLSATDKPPSGRWAQLVFGVIAMMMIANLQYGWTLFVKPMQAANHWAVTDIQWAFTIFIALETWLTPAGGWLVDYLGPNRGPKVAVAGGGILVAVAWVINAYASTLGMLYLGAALSGLGAGAIYATCVGNAVKWFADRRGLAVGITAAGFGAGAAVTVIPIKMMIAAQGYSQTFLVFGLVQGAILFVIAWFLRAPNPGEAPAATVKKAVPQTTRNFTPREMLATPVFWLLYIMFIMVSASGLIATAQLALVASDYKISNTVLFLGGSTLAVALIIDNIMNGAARPFFGWVSDQIGREATMVIAFGLGGVSYLILGSYGTSPWAFVVSAAFIFFTWGEIFSLFPSTCTDTFGSKYATVNAAFLYTAKGTSAFLVPLANVLKAATGTWYSVFLVAAIMNFVVVLLAIFVLRPLRRSQNAVVDPLVAQGSAAE